uniref:Evasin n=1 Tax=Ixodes ricinus TaxID=34613 RepID=A0A6B0VAC1_IXORI
MTLWVLGVVISAQLCFNEARVIGRWCGIDAVEINGSWPIALSCSCKFNENFVGRLPCVSSVAETAEENVVTIVVGKCNFRCLVDENSTKYVVDLQSEPLLASELGFSLHPPCVPLEVKATGKLFVSTNCQKYCYGRKPKDLSDGTLCVIDWITTATQKQKVLRTGACWNGLCTEVHDVPWRHPHGCVDRNIVVNGKTIADSCVSHCNHKWAEIREDGTLCARIKRKNIFGTMKVDTVGVCQQGWCSSISLSKKFTRTEVTTDGCTSPNEILDYSITVAKTCKMMCPNGSTRNRDDGTMCMLEHSSGLFTRQVSTVGMCANGTCIRKSLFQHEPHDPADIGCHVKDFEVESGVFVATKCMASCRHKRKHKVPNGTPCLMYFLRKYSLLWKSEKTFGLGECQDGHCVRGRHSRNITFY